MELYKKHRPDALNKIIGQAPAVATLRTHVEQNTVPHTLLLTGPSGVSKTTIARILKTELGCAESDYTEMNCADLRGIDSARDIIRTMGFAPIGGKCRIWVLDEIHRSTRDFQESMLKALEDTPKHVYFILCTTDPQKLLPTIKTRCTEIKLNSLQHNDLLKLLKRVCRWEEKNVPEEVLEQIATDAAGSARMALVLLDKVINLPEADMAEAAKSHKEQENAAIDLCRKLFSGTFSECMAVVKGLPDEAESVRWAVLGYAKAIMLKGAQIDKAYIVMNAFKNNCYDTKMAGICLACYEVFYGE